MPLGDVNGFGIYRFDFSSMSVILIYLFFPSKSIAAAFKPYEILWEIDPRFFCCHSPSNSGNLNTGMFFAGFIFRMVLRFPIRHNTWQFLYQLPPFLCPAISVRRPTGSGRCVPLPQRCRHTVEYSGCNRSPLFR